MNRSANSIDGRNPRIAGPFALLAVCLLLAFSNGMAAAQDEPASADESELETKLEESDESGEEILYPVELKPYTLTVIDEKDQPIVDAQVKALGVRCEEDPGSWYGWPDANAGKAKLLRTDEAGQITVMYPVKFGLEPGWLTTNKIDFEVQHPDYVHSRVEVVPTEEGITHVLAEGCPVLFSAVDEQGQAIEKFGVVMAGAGGRAKWVLKDGEIRTGGVPDGSWQTMLAAPQDEGPTLFSGILPTRFAKGRAVTIRGVKLTPGIRLSGKVAENVPRPVEAGIVVAWQLPKPRGRVHEQNDPSAYWSDQTVIAEDGSFAFESLPRTGTVQLIALCRGWVIKSEPRDGRGAFFVQGIQVNLDEQEIEDNRLADVELPMEPAGSLEVTVLKEDGSPLEGAQVSTWPNQVLDKSGSQMLGSCYPSAKRLEFQISNNEEDLNAYFAQERKSRFVRLTDAEGKAVLHDIPVGHQQSLHLSHDDFLASEEDTDDLRQEIHYIFEKPERKSITITAVPISKR